MHVHACGHAGEEQISETIITDVYKDPLDVCMEGIEDLATGILRTGKLILNGEPGGKEPKNNSFSPAMEGIGGLGST